MRDEYDFTRAKRGAVLPARGKTRITIMLDDEVLAFFRAQAESGGQGYQTLINASLRRAMEGAHGKDSEPLTVGRLRQILREELRAA